MKKMIWMCAAAAALIVAGCSDQTKENAQKTVQSAATDASRAVETAKAKTSEAMVQAKQAAAEAVEKVKAKSQEAKAAVEAKAAEVVNEAAEKTSKAVETVEKKKTGAALFAKCAGCHGADGKTPALGKSAVIAGQRAQDLVKKLEAYKAGTRNAAGMGTLMHGQVSALSDADIAVLADYISRMK